MQTASKILQKWYKPLHRSEIAELCIEEAMKEYAAQFINLAAKEVIVSNNDPYGSQEEIKKEILNLKNQLK